MAKVNLTLLTGNLFNFFSNCRLIKEVKLVKIMFKFVFGSVKVF